jgi:hypothetical protein
VTHAISYSIFGIRMAELWLHAGPHPLDVPVDLISHMHLSEPVPGGRCEMRHTVTMSLGERDEESLLGDMDAGTRYEIRRAAGKDGLAYASQRVTRLADLDDFVDRFHTMQKQTAAPSLNRRRLAAMAASGQLDLSLIAGPDGRVLTRHLHLTVVPTVRLVYSVSEYWAEDSQAYRNLCGRANRLHHWRDITRFKTAGHEIYDFGGFYTGSDSAKLIRINKFKLGFGGAVVARYNCLVATTAKGRVAQRMWIVQRRLRNGPKFGAISHQEKELQRQSIVD